MDKLETEVIHIIMDKFGVSEDKITPQATFIEDFGADSLDQIEVLMAFEDAFEIEIPDEDTDKLRSVRDVLNYLSKKVTIIQ